jgi:endo-1,4-beta-xylanase
MLGTAAFAAAADEPPPALKDVAARRNIRYGATDELNGQRPAAGYLELFARHCALLAPNLSSPSVWKSADVHDFSRFQAVLDFASDHGIHLTGAHLLWHETAPAFLLEAADRNTAEHLAVEHIQAMCKRFAGQVYSWNVINEAIEPRNGRADGLRDSPLLKQFGDVLFDMAFHAAHEADPSAILVYNDYAMEMDVPAHEARRRALLKLLESWRKRNLPIDAIGLQTHLQWRDFKFEPSRYRSFLRDVAAHGVQIFITEMDVLDHGAPSEIEPRDAAVAEAYRRILDVALDETAVTTLVTWGLSDRYTWLRPSHAARFARPDGLPTRPLPFDDQFQPTPAYWAIVHALEAAPTRPARLA